MKSCGINLQLFSFTQELIPVLRLMATALNNDFKWKKSWIFRNQILLLLGCTLAFFINHSFAQTIPGVDVVRISGPGTEPVFRQAADSMEFSLTMISGILNNDQDVKFLHVESDSTKLFFKKDSTGHFDIFIPNYRYDSLYIFTFLDAGYRILGSYPVVLNNFDSLYSLKARIIALPGVEVIARPPKVLIDLEGGGGESRGCGHHCYSVSINIEHNIRNVNVTEPVYQYRSPQRSLLKVRVGYSAKVEYGSALVPGIDLHLKLDDIRE